MSERRTSALAWGLWTLILVLLVSAVALDTINASQARSNDWLLGSIILAPTAIAIATVGLLVAARRSTNAIGWIYLGSGLWLAAGLWATSYGKWATVTHRGGFAGTFAVWVGNWWWAPFVSVLLTYPFLIFPDGHVLTRRWRPVLWAIGAVTVLWSIAAAFEGDQYADASRDPTSNPYTPHQLVTFFNVGRNTMALAFIMLLACSLLSIVLRFRRSGQRERTQIKWLILAGLVSGAFMVQALATEWTSSDNIGLAVVLALLPISVGVAILRYHLYDIDRIISRTTSYALVTGVLVVVYVAVVTTVSQLLPESSSNALAVAAATLSAAAVFRPVLLRVQGGVDRRFNRSRHDAQRTVDAFALRLRDGVDPDLVADDLLQVVDRMVEPSQTSLWMRRP